MPPLRVENLSCHLAYRILLQLLSHSFSTCSVGLNLAPRFNAGFEATLLLVASATVEEGPNSGVARATGTIKLTFPSFEKLG